MRRLYGRSVLVDKERIIEGDTLYYTKDGDSHGYGNVIYTDKEKQKCAVGR